MIKLHPKEESVLELICESQEYEDYFFRKVEKLKWFFPLKQKGFFNSSKAPAPQETETKGSYQVPVWNVLGYLERISEQINNEENEKYIPDLLQIIKDVSINGPKDNYRTWWYFSKIVGNLPKEVISSEIINLIPTWLDSQFDTSLLGKVIADKILPKFFDSDDPHDLEKAEKIIKNITGLKRVPKEQLKDDYFSSKERYKPYLDDYWLGEAFKNNYTIIAQKCSNEIIIDLKNKIEKLLEMPSNELQFVFKEKTIVLSLSEEDSLYVFAVYRFDSIFTKDQLYELLPSIRKREVINGIEPEENTFDVKNNMTVIIKEIFAFLLGKYPAFKTESERIIKYLTNLYIGLYNNTTYESLYDNKAFQFHKSLTRYIKILRLIMNIRAKEKPDETKEILSLFLSSKYLFIRKYAFYIIGIHYETYNDIFWKYIEEDRENIFLNVNSFGDEMRHIFENIKKEDNITLLDERINQEAEKLLYLKDKELVQRYRQRYYKALSHIEVFNNKFKELQQETNKEVELGPAVKIGESRLGSGPSPLTEEEILKMSNEELALFCNDFKTKDFWDGPTEESLSHAIRSVAKQKPEKLTDNLDPFLNTAYYYIYDMLWGFVDAWNNNEELDWAKLFNFIDQYIKQDAFWNRKFDIRVFDNADHTWVVGVIGELIQVGTQDDAHAFSPEFNNIVFTILDYILDKLPVNNSEEIHDAVTHALNSPHGKLLTGLIYLCLRDARLHKQGVNKLWSENGRTVYESAFTKKVIEAYTLFGQFLGNFHYLDKDWAKEKIKIMEVKDKDLWLKFIEGYLFFAEVYDDIYPIMEFHYRKALKHKEIEEKISDRLVQHIAIGYLRGIDQKLDKPLYDELISWWDHSQLLEMIQFFWMQRDYFMIKENNKKIVKDDHKDKIDKIIAFWRTVYDHYYDNLKSDIDESFQTTSDHYRDKEKSDSDKNNKEILGFIFKLAVFLPEIDEEKYKWLIQSVPYAKYQFNVPFLVEYLNDLKDRGDNKEMTANYICDLYLKALQYYTPEFNPVYIKSTIEYLYEYSKEYNLLVIKDKVDQICTIYAERGILGNDGELFLRDLWKRYNSTDNAQEISIY